MVRPLQFLNDILNWKVSNAICANYFFGRCRSFIPSVVEPSFGIGRIMYCMFEHCFYSREADAQRTVFKFTPLVAPTKATVFPLVSRPEMISKARAISDSLRKAGVSNLIDTTGVNSILSLLILLSIACVRLCVSVCKVVTMLVHKSRDILLYHTICQH